MSRPQEYRSGEELKTGLLYRRIPNDPDRWVVEDRRPTSFNFMPPAEDEYLSMHFGDFIAPEAILPQWPGYGLLEIRVETFLKFELRVTYQPEADDPSHAAVWGLKGAKQLLLRKLRREITRAWEPGSQQLV